jgi:hypothetical protein
MLVGAFSMASVKCYKCENRYFRDTATLQQHILSAHLVLGSLEVIQKRMTWKRNRKVPKDREYEFPDVA